MSVENLWSLRSGAIREKRIPSISALAAHFREDFEANGGQYLRPGFQAVAIYRLGVWIDGLSWRLMRWPLRKIYFLLYVFVRNVYGIEIYFTVRAGRRLRFGHQSGIVIHEWAVIGDDCLIRQNVTIGVARDDTPMDEVPVIGDRVTIGAGAAIISPARIGDDVIIGPNVVVRSHVPSNSRVLPTMPEIEQRGVGRGPKDASVAWRS